MAQRRGGLLRQAQPKKAAKRRLLFHRCPANRHQGLHRAAQREPYALRPTRKSTRHHRRRQAWASIVGDHPAGYGPRVTLGACADKSRAPMLDGELVRARAPERTPCVGRLPWCWRPRRGGGTLQDSPRLAPASSPSGWSACPRATVCRSMIKVLGQLGGYRIRPIAAREAGSRRNVIERLVIAIAER